MKSRGRKKKTAISTAGQIMFPLVKINDAPALHKKNEKRKKERVRERKQ